jgi:hypothetical protein
MARLIYGLSVHCPSTSHTVTYLNNPDRFRCRKARVVLTVVSQSVPGASWTNVAAELSSDTRHHRTASSSARTTKPIREAYSWEKMDSSKLVVVPSKTVPPMTGSPFMRTQYRKNEYRKVKTQSTQSSMSSDRMGLALVIKRRRRGALAEVSRSRVGGPGSDENRDFTMARVDGWSKGVVVIQKMKRSRGGCPTRPSEPSSHQGRGHSYIPTLSDYVTSSRR